MGHDEAFIAIAVAKRLLNQELGYRLLAFARTKTKPVSQVAVDAGVLDERRAARVARLARYRVARAEDRIYAEVAAREGILGRAQALAGLVRQRELYAKGRGFIRLAALLRADRQISREQDRKIQAAVRVFQRAVKTACPNDDCGAVLLATDERCPTCGWRALRVAKARVDRGRVSGSRVA